MPNVHKKSILRPVLSHLLVISLASAQFVFCTAGAEDAQTTQPNSATAPQALSKKALKKKKKTKKAEVISQKSVPESTEDRRQTPPTIKEAPETSALPEPIKESVDDILTNNSLRALSGSKSKWSFASQWNYLGGTVKSPFNEARPNIASASATTDKTDIDGSLNIKYNLNEKTSFLAGFGVRWIAPFTPGGPTNYSGTRFDAINPTLTFQRVYKFVGIQAVFQAAVTQYTQADSVAEGFGQIVTVDQENIYEIGKTGISIGGSIGAGANRFTNDAPNLAAVQSVYQFWFEPYVEYALNDKINLRTVSSLFSYEHYRTGQLVHDTITQSVGVGFSITRDIFLYPNIQFLPSSLDKNLSTIADLTNVGLSATINLF